MFLFMFVDILNAIMAPLNYINVTMNINNNQYYNLCPSFDIDCCDRLCLCSIIIECIIDTIPLIMLLMIYLCVILINLIVQVVSRSAGIDSTTILFR